MIITILQIFTLSVQLYLAFAKNIKHIFLTVFLANFFSMICYAYLQNWTTVILYGIIVLRSFIYLYKEKINNLKYIPFVFAVSHLIIGLALMTDYWQLMIIIVGVYMHLAYWFYGKKEKLNVANMVNNGTYCIYNFVTGLPLIGIARLVIVIANIISLNTRKEV